MGVGERVKGSAGTDWPFSLSPVMVQVWIDMCMCCTVERSKSLGIMHIVLMSQICGIEKANLGKKSLDQSLSCLILFFSLPSFLPFLLFNFYKQNLKLRIMFVPLTRFVTLANNFSTLALEHLLSSCLFHQSYFEHQEDRAFEHGFETLIKVLYSHPVPTNAAVSKPQVTAAFLTDWVMMIIELLCEGQLVGHHLLSFSYPLKFLKSRGMKMPQCP